MKRVLVAAAVVVCIARIGPAQDAPPTISVQDVVVGEGGAAHFPVVLSRPAAANIHVTWKTRTVTASPADYLSTQGEKVLGNDPAPTIDVPIFEDIRVEGSEAFILELTGVTNATIADGVAHGVIRDMQAPPRCTVGDDPGSFILVQYPPTPIPKKHGGPHDLWRPTSTIVEKDPLATLADSEWEIEATGDFDGDGACEFLWGSHEDPDELAMTHNTHVPEDEGAVVQWARRPGRGWRVVGSADLDGDAMADVVWWDPGQRQLAVRLGSHQGFQDAPLVDCAAPAGEPVALTRAAADHSMDILWQSLDNGGAVLVGYSSMQWAEGLGMLACTGSGSLMSYEPAAQVVAAGDFDGDGFDDVLWQAPAKDASSVPILSMCFLHDRHSRACSAVSLDHVTLGPGTIVGPR